MKQVIVIRKDLNMRKGKMVAQGSHASLGAALQTPFEELLAWRGGFNGRKICVSVNSEVDLFVVRSKAEEAGLNCYLVKDIGLTEFKEPTYTALCIGPHDDEMFDDITGDLPLL